jgi:hypothetical protein
LALYDKLTSACILIRRTCSRSPPVRKVRLALASPVGYSDVCKAEPSRGSKSEPWYGPSPRASPRSGTQARFSPTERSVGVTSPGGLDEVTAHEDDRPFQVWSWAS